jgi:hypothetical protein
MGKLRSLSVKRPRTDRDEELRAAHRRVFEDIERSRSAPAREELVSDALQRLIDACEAYCQARHAPGASQPRAS